MTTVEYPRTLLGALRAEADVRLVPLRVLAVHSWRRVRSVAVTATAFACFTSAAFTWQPWAGLVTAGVSLLVLEQSWEAAERREREQ